MKPEVFIEVNMKIKDLEMEIAELLGTNISLSFEFSKPADNKVSIEEIGMLILNAVAEFYEINIQELLSDSKKGELVKCREFIVRFLWDYFTNPDKQKVAQLIKRDRSSLYNLRDNFNNNYKNYQEYRDSYNALQSYLYTKIKTYELSKRK